MPQEGDEMPKLTRGNLGTDSHCAVFDSDGALGRAVINALPPMGAGI
jgi:hypothetical protein